MNNRLQSLLMVVLVLLALSQDLSAQQKVNHDKPVDLGALTKEIMIMDFTGEQSHLAMWFPTEFFVAAAQSDGKASKAEATRDLEFLKPYITIIVQSSFDQPDGTSVYADEKEMRARAALRLADGTNVLPLDKVPARVSATIAAMKAVITSEGDASSANLHILVFPATTKKGERIVDTAQQASLTLVLKADTKFKERTFTWRTPFDSLVTVPDCPRCKAGVSAKWSFCPYCGQKLPHE